MMRVSKRSGRSFARCLHPDAIATAEVEQAEREVRLIAFHMTYVVCRANSPPDRFLTLLTRAYKNLSGFDFATNEATARTI